MGHPDDRRYHREDTWALVEGAGRVRVGITDYAQDQLGSIVFVDLPEPGDELTLGEPFGQIESDKTVADLHAPLSGVVVEANARLEGEPDLVNRDPHGQGWIVLVEGEAPEGEPLLDAEAYEAYLAER